jgi:hypothetical protein
MSSACQNVSGWYFAILKSGDDGSPDGEWHVLLHFNFIDDAGPYLSGSESSLCILKYTNDLSLAP